MLYLCCKTGDMLMAMKFSSKAMYRESGGLAKMYKFCMITL